MFRYAETLKLSLLCCTATSRLALRNALLGSTFFGGTLLRCTLLGRLARGTLLRRLLHCLTFLYCHVGVELRIG